MTIATDLAAHPAPRWMVDAAAEIVAREGGVARDALGRYVVSSQYVVTIDHGLWTCTCPAGVHGTRCKHLLAALHVHTDESNPVPTAELDDPFAGLGAGF